MPFRPWLVAVPLLCLAADAPFSGLPEVRSIVFDGRGALFATTGDSIVQVLGPELVQPLARTGGSPSGLAVSPSGDLYAADPVKRAVLKISLSGHVMVAADTCGDRPLAAPVDVTPQLYYVDRETSRVCRGAELISSAVQQPTAIAASLDGRTIYVGDERGGVWKVASKPVQVAKGEGPVTGLALDSRGNLYVARNTLTVITPDRGVINGLRVPGTPADVTFGVADPKSIFVATGTEIHRRSVPYPMQSEEERAVRILEPRNGSILNRHDGTVTAEGLRITVRGHARGAVRVNGDPAEVKGDEFTATVTLNAPEMRITAESAGEKDEVRVLWDRHSYARYRVSVDDNIRWLKDIAQHEPAYASIFDNPYLARWRELHRKYGIKVHFNLYYETSGFNLSQMPDRYRAEWQANADWIRLSFHARANDPDRPYLHSTGTRIREDCRLVHREIERFAGKELLSTVTTIHWGEATPAAMEALRSEGIRIFAGYFELRRELPGVSYDVPMPVLQHLSRRDYWKDIDRDLFFVRHDLVLNGVDLDDVVPRLEKLTEHQSEVLELMIHEQHFYPDFKAGYRPDYFDRIERAVQWAAGRGYKPVFFGEGFLGAK